MKVEIEIPDALHPDSRALVAEFATALADKLRQSEIKYGFSNEWRIDAWERDCRVHLIQHLLKGDPRDVAIYAAFMWKRGWSTSDMEMLSKLAARAHADAEGVPA